MSDKRTHPMVFGEDALPSVFHQTPDQFLFYLERDGNKFLRFYWDKVGKEFSESDRVDSYGLNYFIHKPQRNIAIVIVTLPTPHQIGEAYFEAFVYRPLRVTPILRISDVTTVFILVRDFENHQALKTRIYERTKKDQSLDRGVGPPPKIDEFYQAVIELIKDSRGEL